VHLGSPASDEVPEGLERQIAEEQAILGPGARQNEGSPIVHPGSSLRDSNSEAWRDRRLLLLG